MSSFTVKSFDQIVSDMVAWIVANSPNITDMTPGSVIRSFCEGSALGIEEVYVATYLGFRRYLSNVQETVFDFPRKYGSKSSVAVVFSRPSSGAEVTILAGTRVITASGLRFLTNSEVTVANGVLSSASVLVTAEKNGAAYNVSSSAINSIEDAIAEGIDTVTNALAATGGVDGESDISFKNRFQSYIEGLGRTNLSGLRAGALGVEGITSASVVELFPPVAGVNVNLYVDDGTSGGVSTALVAEVQSVINGDGTQENPGYRAAGVNVQVVKPGIVTQNVSATLSILSGVDTEQLKTDVINALTEYVNTLGVGKNIIFNELVSAIMRVFGVTDVAISTPAGNVTVAATQVGRLGTITLFGV